MNRSIPIEHVPGHPGFRPLRDIAGVRQELRYATANNFVGRDLYSPFDCAWLHGDAAAALERARDALASVEPRLCLLVLDALRPQRVQERMWAALEGTGLQIYLANPERGSIHSFGMAVDVTLCDAQGRELDMATPFDDLTERSHPALEEALLAKGAIAREGVENRRILREAMTRAGWLGISREWWHFDAGDRERIRATFPRVL
jgi:zinc D-Ala-D-Ala dipeptidase